MWLVVGGRLTETIISAVKEYQNIELVGEETIDDLYNNKDSYSDLKCIAVLDSGLNTLKDWTPLKQVSRHFEDVEILVYTRHPEMTPRENVLGDNIKVSTNTGYISISEMAKRLGDYK